MRPVRPSISLRFRGRDWSVEIFVPGVVYSNSRSAPLHGDARGHADLDPDTAWAGLIRAIDFLREEALGASRHARANGRPNYSEAMLENWGL
jgi:hypothetical protein